MYRLRKIKKLIQESVIYKKAGSPVKYDREAVMVMVYSLYGGGAERVACMLASHLSEKYHVIMLYREDKGKTYGLAPDIELIRIPDFSASTCEILFQKMAHYTGLLKKARNVKAAFSFMSFMNYINAESKTCGKTICSERNNPAKKEPEKMDIIQKIYEKADHVVFQSETVRSLFTDTVRAHSSIIVNPVEVYCKKKEQPAHRIVNVGRLSPQKNQALLIRAFSEFLKEYPDYTLSIYGEGEKEEELSSLARQLAVCHAVIFEGNKKDVHSLIADAEMFVLSSDYEGMSNALLECMAMGIPCISTACEGSADIIKDGKNGLLVPAGDADALCKAMKRLAADEDLRQKLGNEAAGGMDKYSKDRVFSQWTALIEDKEGIL